MKSLLLISATVACVMSGYLLRAWEDSLRPPPPRQVIVNYARNANLEIPFAECQQICKDRQRLGRQKGSF